MYSHFQRDISSEVAGVKNTFSGWDQCMTKAYCKWPAIVGIILGCLIALSIVWCLIRCICCGAECCCGCLSCLSCCTSCCSNGRHRNKGYQQAAPQFPQYTQYQPAPAPVYAQQPQYTQKPQYAHFDVSNNRKINEDALPAMPSWETSRTTRQMEDVEMGRMQASPMLPKTADAHVQEYPYQSNAHAYGGDMGMSSPYEQYGYGQNAPYHNSNSYSNPPSAYQSPRMQSPAPPSYHTAAPEMTSGVARKPVAGTWRDL